jgi:dihydroorotase
LDTVTLTKNPWKVPAAYGEHSLSITPLKANEELVWQMQQ